MTIDKVVASAANQYVVAIAAVQCVGPVKALAAMRLSLSPLVNHTAGTTAKLAGISSTITVSVTDFAPLLPGVTDEFWLVSRSPQSDGPESDHVTHIATRTSQIC